jgi:probable rRNA maturation factor
MSGKPVSVAISIEDAAWRKAFPGAAAKLRQAARLACARRETAGKRSLAILLGDDARLAALNRQFRGKDGPTNVLSFPAADAAGNHLGDIAIAYGVAAREAREAGKIFAHHATHLAVHGVLHLLGYDHETERDARIMEPLEREILAMLTIPDPYAPRRAA